MSHFAHMYLHSVGVRCNEGDETFSHWVVTIIIIVLHLFAQPQPRFTVRLLRLLDSYDWALGS